MVNLIAVKHFIYKKYFFNVYNIKSIVEWNNYIILYDGFWDYVFFNLINEKIFSLIKLKKKIKFFFNLNFKINKLNLLLSEYDLKGVNYWFSNYDNIIFFDLGQSNFRLLYFYWKFFFFKLKKKKLKWLLFISINKTSTIYLSSFLRYNLKKVGPYKLKGFQFVNEKFKLKEGKKPFK